MGAGLPVPITPLSLSKAIDEGFKQLDPHRQRFRETNQEYLGTHVGKGDGIRRPVNLIAQSVSILLSNILSSEPKHRVRSPMAELRGEADMLALALDRLWQDTQVLGEVRAAVLDVILGFAGVLRLGMRAGTQFITVEDGKRVPVAEPFCRRISLEDYACDPAARSQHELRWEAVRYRMSKQEAIDSGVFGRDPQDYGPDDAMIENVATRDEAAAILTNMPAMDATARPSDLAAAAGKPAAGPDTFRLVETIELWDVFVYLDGEIWTVTVPARQTRNAPTLDAGKWLLCEKWEGPDTGPLIVFGFCDIPDQPIFKPVVADWHDLHDFCRVVSSKLYNEIQNSKVVWGYTGENEDDALSIKERGDSGLVRLQSKDSVVKIEVNGIVKDLMPGLEWAKTQWADASGNLPLTGGQNSEATDKTATAAQYLQANASQRIAEMRDRTEKVLAAIDRHFGWYLTSDPLVQLPLPYRLPGGEMTTLTFDAATRRGDFQSYSFDIERYSAVGQDPNVRLKRVGDFLGLVVNLIPLIQAGVVSMDGMAGLGEKEYGIENLDELLPAQAQGLQMQAHNQRQGIQPGMGVPQQMNGMGGPQGGQQFPQLPAPNNAGMTPIGLGRGAMTVGAGA